MGTAKDPGFPSSSSVWPEIGSEDLQPILSALAFRAARRLIILDDGLAGWGVAPGDLVGSIARNLCLME